MLRKMACTVKRLTGVTLVLMVLFSGCTTKKQLVYLQNVDSIPDGTVYYKQPVEYRIQNQDILYIRVMSVNEEINDQINTFSTRYSQNLFQNEISLYLYGYSINDSGYVNVPYIGEVYIMGETVEEAQKIIQAKVDESIRNSTVIVKLISFKYSVLGEVASPGRYYNYNNQLTVFEALSAAGDLTDYADRKKVLVIRPTKDATKTFRMDLTDKDILTSEAFFLLPNDIVYIQPIGSKIFRVNIPTMTLFLASLSTLILIMTFVTK